MFLPIGNSNIISGQTKVSIILFVGIINTYDIHFRTQNNKTYGAINRINLNRVITLSSTMLTGYNATRINQQIKEVIQGLDMPGGYRYEFTGEQDIDYTEYVPDHSGYQEKI